MTGPFL